MNWRFLLVCVIFLIPGVRTVPAQSVEPVVIGSKNFTESRVLTEIMAQLIEARTDIPVERRTGLGGTMVVFGALRQGDIDIYPDYTGTGWAIILKKQEKASDPLKTYLTVKREFETDYGITWLEPFGFSNSYAVAISDQTADRLNITRISDLAAHDERLRAGWSLEFLNREDGLPGLSEHYGFQISDERGLEHGLAYEAISSGKIDLIDAYTTDGKLLKFPVRILEDDKNFFPPYECAPLIRLATLEKHPRLKPLLNELAFKLSDEKMQKLNFDVEEAGKPFADVARAFLLEQKLIDAGTPETKGEVLRGENLGQFIAGRLPVTLNLIGEHLLLTGLALFFAALIAVPVGIRLTRYESLSGIIIGATGVIQTIPSLALLAFMIPIPGLGLSSRSAIVALFLYALLPIVRNTYTGIKEVEPSLIEAAVGMGLREREILRYVQMPLAVPTIMAGIRTAAVISIGVATLAAFIGGGGLGEPIITGLQLNDPRLIMSGAIPAALLALLADWLLGLAERALSPIR